MRTRSRNWTLFGFLLYLVCLVPVFYLDAALRGWGTFWAFVAATAGTVFVVAYGVFAPWRKNPDGSSNHSGQHLMVFSAAITIIMWFVIASSFGLIPMAWAPYIRAIVYITVAFLMLWRLVLYAGIKVRALRTSRAARGTR